MHYILKQKQQTPRFHSSVIIICACGVICSHQPLCEGRGPHSVCCSASLKSKSIDTTQQPEVSHGGRTLKEWADLLNKGFPPCCWFC